MQDLARDRIEESLRAFRLVVVDQQTDVVELDTFPKRIRALSLESGGAKLALDPIDRFGYALVVVVDPVARHMMHRAPIAVLEVPLRGARAVAEKCVMAVESLAQRHGHGSRRVVLAGRRGDGDGQGTRGHAGLRGRCSAAPGLLQAEDTAALPFRRGHGKCLNRAGRRGADTGALSGPRRDIPARPVRGFIRGASAIDTMRHHNAMNRGIYAAASRRGKAAGAVLLAVLWTFAASGLVTAEVIKCTDADGNVSYQDIPCGQGQAGRPVALPQAETKNETDAWQRAAGEARVVKGMPKRWVLRARGAPTEIRPASAREQASEVWRYAGRDGVMLVGFTGPEVVWVREDVASRDGESPAKAVATETAATGAQNRRFVIAGRECAHVFAEIGQPDRQEPLPAAGGPAPGMRNFYDPQPADGALRTVFSCVGGKVVDVERTVVQ